MAGVLVAGGLVAGGLAVGGLVADGLAVLGTLRREPRAQKNESRGRDCSVARLSQGAVTYSPTFAVPSAW